MFSFTPDDESAYTIDECKIRGFADTIYIPENELELQGIVKDCYDNEIPITINAMRTGLCGGGVPFGGIVISMEKMDKIIGLGKDDTGYFLRVQPCVTVSKISDILMMKRIDNFLDITENACSLFKNDKKSYFYPVDPTEMNGSIGGNIVTNASGPRTFCYGPTRNWVKRIRVMLSNSSIIDIERGMYFADDRHFNVTINNVCLKLDIPFYEYNMDVKNSTGLYSKKGMDLIDLFIGSEGILGIIIEADIRLTEWHPLISNIIFMPNDKSALSLIKDIKHDNVLKPEFLEYFDTGSVELIKKSCKLDPTILVPPEGVHSAVFMDMSIESMMNEYDRLFQLILKNGGNPGESWSGHDSDDRKKMFRFRHSVPKSIFDYVASIKKDVPSINKMGTDMAVPENVSEEMMAFYKEKLDESGLEYVIFGHMGNNHPHVEIILKDLDDLEKAREVYRIFAEKAIELGGSPSAEHGIGKLKKEYIKMMYGSEGIESIRFVKKAFDPKNILNRGNMID